MLRVRTNNVSLILIQQSPSPFVATCNLLLPVINTLMYIGLNESYAHFNTYELAHRHFHFRSFVAGSKLPSPDLVAQCLIRGKERGEIGALLEQQVRNHAPKDRLAMRVQVRAVAVAQVIV
jgi:hypothetical protein